MTAEPPGDPPAETPEPTPAQPAPVTNTDTADAYDDSGPFDKGGSARPDAEERAAYRRGFQNLHGATAFIDDSEIGQFILGDYYSLSFDDGPSTMAGSIRADALDLIRATYVPVPGYPELLAAVRDHRVLVLHSRPGTGRGTTAVRLLDEVTEGKVSRLDLADGIRAVKKKDLKVGRGYVIRMPAPYSERNVCRADLDWLRDLVESRRSYCVLLAATARRSPEYARAHTPPDFTELVRRHVTHQCGTDQPDDLLGLCADKRIIAALGTSPRPAHGVRLARLLVRRHRSEIGFDDVLRGCEQLVSDEVADWFRGLFDNPDDEKATSAAIQRASFRIALAVLNLSPYKVVATQAELLAQRMIAAIKPSKAQPAMLFTDRDILLDAARAHIVDDRDMFGDTTIPIRIACFDDDRLPLAVLRHVWRHDALQDLLVAWLAELSRNRAAIVWVRAAQVAGLLMTWGDFQYAFDKLVRPGARSDSKRERRFAAVALDEAARDHQVGRRIRQLLRYWRRDGRESERWTAAAALGYDIGRQSIESTLNELRILGTPDERTAPLVGPTPQREMLGVVSYSVSQLLAFGEVEPVLACLAEWLAHRRFSVRDLALWTVARLIEMRCYNLDLVALTGGREHRSISREYDTWPLLLTLRHSDRTLTEPVGEVLRLALRSRYADTMLYGIKRWITTAQENRECLAALIDFVPHLVENRDDAARLTHLIARMRHDWSDPLTDDAAAALQAAIQPETKPWTNQNVS
jgi:hypothetical protein